MDSQSIDYQLDGIPAELAEQVRRNPSIRKYLEEERATGIRLERLDEGWSYPRSGHFKEAYEVHVLGRPSAQNNERYREYGRCYVQDKDGEWNAVIQYHPIC